MWSHPDFDNHEKVHFFTDAATGLRAIIAVHSTFRGPSSGGVRFWHYAREEDALTDALRLSRGMSYKNAMAGLPVGGGKGVILSDGQPKTRAQLLAFGDAIETLAGAYVTAEDVGMSDGDMETIAERTRHVSGLPVAGGQAGGSPGPLTAIGVHLGVRAAVARGLGRDDLSGVHVAIQGLGAVGGGLARKLAADGARLTLADVNVERAKALAAELGAEAVSADAIMTVEADVFSPNALGAILDARSIPLLRAGIVAGGANNQLATAADAQLLHARGILYAPDYVINAGGIINVATEYFQLGDGDAVMARIEQIPERLRAIWDQSATTGRPAADVADEMARGLIGRG
ncbi:Leu/Phe/Val dehydrogenase [Sphingobium nicotianae]|uniref:Amino acid dehydrogenase n=1 Tax=Sphingobium nicotianae TaxID=2782607 RepID=A0A9X1DBX2_9SPHN|nr:Glu/Leu/Phe/Val dehydrogenase dimerization domain-containing protein [Sphingobium nicotianae]MBT2187116.1 amino acid dehydrogenase [Sphingobium nicotianae]